MQQILQDIQKILRIDSSQMETKTNMPFGQGIFDTLHYFLNLAETMGFKTINYDNYIAEVIYEGTTEEKFAVLCHLDTVPIGNGWTQNPFGEDIVDGKLYGRGSMDNKAIAVICLHCLNALKKENFKPRKTIHLIVGCNEENGWQCIAYYKQKATLPEIGFTPDGNFPVIYAEKGILHANIHFKIDNAPFFSIATGEQLNMVCDRATATCTSHFAQVLDNLKLMPQDIPKEITIHRGHVITRNTSPNSSSCLVIAHGKSAHASHPERGDNALYKLLCFFAPYNADIQKIKELFVDDAMQLQTLNDASGYLTYAANVATFQENTLTIGIDIRYPASMKQEDILNIFDKHQLQYELLHCQNPIFHSPDSPLIQTLYKIYKEKTGRRDKPMAIGGGTYARALKFGVAFGPQFNDEEDSIHQPNEYIFIKNIPLYFDIYKEAIFRLTK